MNNWLLLLVFLIFALFLFNAISVVLFTINSREAQRYKKTAQANLAFNQNIQDEIEKMSQQLRDDLSKPAKF